METHGLQPTPVDFISLGSEPLLPKYEVEKSQMQRRFKIDYKYISCSVSQLCSLVNEENLVADGMSILHALEKSHSIATEIQLQEPDELFAAAHAEIANQLSWNHTALSSIIAGRSDPAAGTSTGDARSSIQDMEGSYKKEEARRKAIEATRQEPMVDGLISIAGLTKVKKMLWENGILPSKFPHLFRGGRHPGNCILLYGPPGTGKTRLAHAFASEISATFYSVSSSDLLSSWVGESEKMVRELFTVILYQEERSVLFIDEVDSIARQRTASEDDLTRRLKTEMLIQLEKCGNKSNIHVVCATNCPWEIDSALLRRFHNCIYIPLPKREERAEIFLMHIQDTQFSLMENEWEILLNCTEGYSGSDIANLTRNALMEPIREMVDSTSWMQKPNGDFISCSDTHPGAMYTSVFDLPAEKVTVRNVILDDFLKARSITRKTVTEDDNERFEKFATRFGQSAHEE